MPTRLFLRGTQTEPSTGGVNYDMLPDMGAGNGTVQFSFNDTAFVETGRFVRQLSAAPSETSFPVSVNVASLEGTIEYRFRPARFTSAGTFVQGGTYSPLYNTAGVKTTTLSFTPSAWNSGDLLVLTMEGRRTGGHGNVRFNVTVGDVSSYVDATFVSDPDPVSAEVTDVTLATEAAAPVTSAAVSDTNRVQFDTSTAIWSDAFYEAVVVDRNEPQRDVVRSYDGVEFKITEEFVLAIDNSEGFLLEVDSGIDTILLIDERSKGVVQDE
jgi:hypothetical protein